mgnify:CR=1 FL=1
MAGAELVTVDAQKQFLDALRGVIMIAAAGAMAGFGALAFADARDGFVAAVLGRRNSPQRAIGAGRS